MASPQLWSSGTAHRPIAPQRVPTIQTVIDDLWGRAAIRYSLPLCHSPGMPRIDCRSGKSIQDILPTLGIQVLYLQINVVQCTEQLRHILYDRAPVGGIELVELAPYMGIYPPQFGEVEHNRLQPSCHSRPCCASSAALRDAHYRYPIWATPLVFRQHTGRVCQGWSWDGNPVTAADAALSIEREEVDFFGNPNPSHQTIFRENTVGDLGRCPAASRLVSKPICHGHCAPQQRV